MNNTFQNSDLLLKKNVDTDDIDFKEILNKYISYWRWFVVSIFFFLTAAFIYLRYQTPLYNIKTSILIKDEKKGMSQDAMLKELNLFSSSKIVDNEIEILKSFTLMEKVVKGLNLNIHYYAKKTIKDTELYGNSPIVIELIDPDDQIYSKPISVKRVNPGFVEVNSKKYPVNKVLNTPYGKLRFLFTDNNHDVKELLIKVQPIERAIENNIEKLKVEPSSKMSSVLVLSLEDAVPQRGKDILNNLIQHYNQAAIEDKNQVASNTLVFIEERLKLISSDLNTVEKTVEEFKSREGITNISAESELFLKSVQENDLQLSKVKIQEDVLKNISDYVNSKNNKGNVPATLGVSDPTLLALISRLMELEMQREKYIKLVKQDNPLVESIDEQINNAKVSIGENIRNLQKNLYLTRKQLESQNSRLEKQIKTIPGKERNLVDITRQQAIKNKLYMFLLEKREETALSFASAVSDSRTIDMARSSLGPVKPLKKIIYMLFAFLGVIVPFIVIYIIELLNNNVKKRQEIEKATQTPIIAEVSFSDKNEALVISNLGRTIIAEQIRALRTNLSYLASGNLKSILFTSSMSGEGKSFISLNLGASLAMTAKKTIILELDLRKPKLHPSLQISNNKGLSNFLIGKVTIDEIIQIVPGQENYYIITSGPIPPNPVELLVNGRLDILFEELKANFDYVIIDAPPVGIVTDAQILEKHADATMFVLRHNYTPKERLKYINALYIDKRFKNMSLIFNAVREGGRYGYSSYGYGYYQNDLPRLNTKHDEVVA